jgi:transposase InsO family protein
MTPKIHPLALFRLSVLSRLTNHDHFDHGELKLTLADLASQTYAIPNSRRCHLSEKTIESWYYRWKQGGIDALAPRQRNDKGLSKIACDVQEMLLQAKRDNPRRSLDELIRLLEKEGVVAKDELKRSAVYRLLKQHGISRPIDNGNQPIERRSFVAEHASDIWYGDVMHGPKVVINGRLRKAYLVSLMDDASRLITHSAFCPGETALDIEGVLKQAFLKRGLPKKLVIDNGAAYRAVSFQGICARLSVPLVYCRPYEPEAKGKLERWHRVVRQQFLSELTSQHLQDLNSLNIAIWAWVEKVYHTREHSVLKCTPLARWQKDLEQMRTLGPYAHDLDELFYHRYTRKVRKNGTVSFNGQFFEVDYLLVGRKIQLVTDPQTNRVISVGSLDGTPLGQATPLDELSNNQRHRQRSVSAENEPKVKTNTAGAINAIEQVSTSEPFTITKNKD